MQSDISISVLFLSLSLFVHPLFFSALLCSVHFLLLLFCPVYASSVMIYLLFLLIYMLFKVVSCQDLSSAEQFTLTRVIWACLNQKQGWNHLKFAKQKYKGTKGWIGFNFKQFVMIKKKNERRVKFIYDWFKLALICFNAMYVCSTIF